MGEKWDQITKKSAAQKIKIVFEGKESFFSNFSFDGSNDQFLLIKKITI